MFNELGKPFSLTSRVEEAGLVQGGEVDIPPEIISKLSDSELRMLRLLQQAYPSAVPDSEANSLGLRIFTLTRHMNERLLGSGWKIVKERTVGYMLYKTKDY